MKKFNYYACWNTETKDWEGGQNMLASEAEAENDRNIESGNPRRWIIDRENNESPYSGDQPVWAFCQS